MDDRPDQQPTPFDGPERAGTSSDAGAANGARGAAGSRARSSGQRAARRGAHRLSRRARLLIQFGFVALAALITAIALIGIQTTTQEPSPRGAADPSAQAASPVDRASEANTSALGGSSEPSPVDDREA